MFAADYLRRCKYKEKFANNIHCGLFFCKFTPFSSKSAIPAPVFFHYTSFYSFCLQMYETKNEKWKKRRNHFFHFILFREIDEEVLRRSMVMAAYCC